MQVNACYSASWGGCAPVAMGSADGLGILVWFGTRVLWYLGSSGFVLCCGICVCVFFFAIFVYIRAFFFVCVIGVDAVFVFKKKICFLLYVQGLSNICSD